MPPFSVDKYNHEDRKSWYYSYSPHFNLSVENREDDTRGELTVNVQIPKGRRILFLSLPRTIKLAEVRYQKSS